MRELVILSGKGGTGKTSLTGAFASFSKNKILCDADVDAADLHLLTQPDIQRKSDFEGGGVAVIRREECSECGLCSELCRFEAIKDTFEVDEIACEGCGVCVDLCPENAIDFPVKKCGEWYVSATRFGYMVHARLGIAEENSGKLVTVVRQEAKKLAEKHGADLIITDGPPGAGCPVIASMSDATAVLIVTEPTVSGVHDMERAADLVRHFRIPGAVCINKYDLNREKALEAERAAEKRNMPITGRIPFDPAFTKAMIQGKTLCEYDSASVAGKAVQQAWKQIMALPAMQGEGVISL